MKNVITLFLLSIIISCNVQQDQGPKITKTSSLESYIGDKFIFNGEFFEDRVYEIYVDNVNYGVGNILSTNTLEWEVPDNIEPGLLSLFTEQGQTDIGELFIHRTFIVHDDDHALSEFNMVTGDAIDNLFSDAQSVIVDLEFIGNQNSVIGILYNDVSEKKQFFRFDRNSNLLEQYEMTNILDLAIDNNNDLYGISDLGELVILNETNGSIIDNLGIFDENGSELAFIESNNTVRLDYYDSDSLSYYQEYDLATKTVQAAVSTNFIMRNVQDAFRVNYLLAWTKNLGLYDTPKNGGVYDGISFSIYSEDYYYDIIRDRSLVLWTSVELDSYDNEFTTMHLYDDASLERSEFPFIKSSKILIAKSE